MNNTLKVIGGVLLGAAIGAGIGLLVAPTNGKKSRDMVTKKSKKYSKQAMELAAEYMNGMKKNYNKKVDSYAQNGKSTLDSLKETVKM